jgi:serine/threonine protein kinase
MNAGHDDALAGTLVSRYRIVSLIGTGGMGRVYLGRDEHLLRHVAIKVLTNMAPLSGGSPFQLLREARLLSRLSHPFVAGIFDLLRCGSRECLVMEFVPGPTLNEVIASGPLPAAEVIRLGIQLAKGLAAAHGARVIHRDLKPQNIKLTPSGRLKILDFGVATSAGPVDFDSTAVTHSTPVGTVPYMSPEQIRGDDLDERTDIFSAGAVLYEMASGRRAFPQCNLAELVNAIQFDEPPPLSTVNPLVPGALELVISRALQKNRDRRQPSASRLAADLRAVRFLQCVVRERRPTLEAIAGRATG